MADKISASSASSAPDSAALRSMMELAAEQGARRALAKLGLTDDQAGEDIRDLRALIEAWRETKTTVWRTALRFVTLALLTAIAVGLAVQLKLFQIHQN